VKKPVARNKSFEKDRRQTCKGPVLRREVKPHAGEPPDIHDEYVGIAGRSSENAAVGESVFE
jgi:hypothetical protein